MKRLLINLSAIVAVALSVVGCGAFDTLSSADNATGTPYELIVVCDQPQWQSELGDTLQVILKQPVKELVQYEPMFDVLRILPNNFKSLTRQHRNILVVQVDPTIAEPSIAVSYDYTAKPQVYINIQGPDTRTVTQYVSDHRENLLYVLEKAERDRTISYAERYYSKAMYQLMKDRFGVDMYIPDNFKIRTESDDMVWISQEFPTASQGFFVYKYPYEGRQSLTAEALVKARNRFAGRIPGPTDGSYMITVDKITDETGEGYVPFKPQYRPLMIGDRQWIEMAGLWDVENYFMGGPFVSYTTVNEDTKEVITIDCYIYSPREKKRNMLRELQQFVYLMEFPADAAASPADAATPVVE